MTARLDPSVPLEAPDPTAAFSLKVLDSYRTYWREAAAVPSAHDAALAAHTRRLWNLLGAGDGALDRSALEGLVFERIRAEGYHPLGGRTGRLYELMLWSKQETRDVSVALPEGVYSTRVFMLDGFESRGWSNWLTCDATGTGGWAKSDGVYVVVSVYGDLQGEDFRVSLLGHETQHFADYKTWPGLPGRELEYRAKLTELSLSDVTREALLAAFERNQSDNEADPHSHANKRVLAALRARLGLAPDADLEAVAADDLREAARQELFADTARRRAAGAVSAPTT